MRSADDVIARAVSKAAEKQAKRALKLGITTLTGAYRGTDSEGKGWVLLPGAYAPTPVRRMSAAAEVGDTVSVTIGGGRATLDSNISNPSAGTKTVTQVREVANGAQQTADGASKDAQTAIAHANTARAAATDAMNAAESAQSEASSAAESASNAQASADTAFSAAQQALADAASVASSAEAAKESAATAAQSASEAVESADKAQRGLSEVERVVGTVNWIAEHGEYVNQAGQQFDPSKVYYTRSGTSPDYVYTVVAEPVAADIASYYVLRVDESVQNYIASHLWLDSYGLNLSVDGADGWRLHQGTFDGTKPTGVYIIDPNDETVQTMNANGVQIGKSDESHMELDYHSLQLIDKEGDTYFHVSDLRDSSGVAELTVSFTLSDEDYSVNDGYGYIQMGDHLGNMGATGFTSVSIDGTPISDSEFESEPGLIIKLSCSPLPEIGQVAVVSFTTRSNYAKAYTIGRRRANSNIGAYSVVSGLNCVASEYASSAEGVNTSATGQSSSAEGIGSIASGMGSHAEGYNTTASGQYSHAEGMKTTASSYYAHAEGKSTFAIEHGSHAEGAITIASGIYSHAEGYNTAASGQYSHAEGRVTTASGPVSHAEGRVTTASGSYSHTQNEGTIAASEAQTALGKYNLEDANDVYAAIIGNGTSDSARSNAFAVDWDGIPYHRNLSDTWGSVFDLIYPVGSIYMSVNSTNPKLLFGGDWERISGKFLLGATDGGATGTNVQSNASAAPGASGGEPFHTLASTEMPVHKHTMDNSGATDTGTCNDNTGASTKSSTDGESKHTHGLNSHTHASPANRNWLSYNYGSGSGTITTGVGKARANASSGNDYVPRVANASVDFSRSGATAGPSTPNTTEGSNHSHGMAHTHNLGNHKHSVPNHTHTMQDAGGSNGTTQAHNNMPPFLAVYVWKRTA